MIVGFPKISDFLCVQLHQEKGFAAMHAEIDVTRVHVLENSMVVLG